MTLKTSTQVAIAFLCPCPCPCILRCPFFFPAFSRFPSRVVDDNDDDPISIWNRTPHPAPADAVTIVVCHGELPHIPCSCTISSITLLPLSLPPLPSPAVPPIPLVLLCSRLINFCAVACPSLNPCALWCHVRNCTYHFCYPPPLSPSTTSLACSVTTCHHQSPHLSTLDPFSTAVSALFVLRRLFILFGLVAAFHFFRFQFGLCLFFTLKEFRIQS